LANKGKIFDLENRRKSSPILILHLNTVTVHLLLILWTWQTAAAYNIAQNGSSKNYLSHLNKFCALNRCICKVSGIRYEYLSHNIRGQKHSFEDFCENFGAKIGQGTPTW